MKLRAEQWAMVGVVALGITAAYLLTRAKGGAAGLPDSTGGHLPPSTPSPLGLPGALPSNLLVPNIVHNGHALLRRGNNVLGRLEIGFPNGAGDATTALQNLQRAGFDNVQLYTLADTKADPGLVTLHDALVNPGPGSRWFWATWNGNGSVASGDILLPREVVLLWHTATLPTRTSASTTGLSGFAG